MLCGPYTSRCHRDLSVSSGKCNFPAGFCVLFLGTPSNQHENKGPEAAGVHQMSCLTYVNRIAPELRGLGQLLNCCAARELLGSISEFSTTIAEAITLPKPGPTCPSFPPPGTSRLGADGARSQRIRRAGQIHQGKTRQGVSQGSHGHRGPDGLPLPNDLPREHLGIQHYHRRGHHIAETGADMSVFPTTGHFAPWGGWRPEPTNPPGGSNPPRQDPARRISRQPWAPRP